MSWFAYACGRLYEQFVAVGMISGYLTVFYVVVLRELPTLDIFLGLASVVVGIALFMEGFLSGIMPLGEMLGRGLPDKFSLGGAMNVTFFLGIACTLAEPAMGALELAGSLVDVTNAPVLWYLLNTWNSYLVMAIGLGVGVAALVGTVRLLRKWSLKVLIYISVFLTVSLTLFCVNAGLAELVGLAWDAGAVTTGAVTVPIILGLGVGIMKTVQTPGEQENPLDGFGIVTLASLYPVVTVLMLGLLCAHMHTAEEIRAVAEAQAQELEQSKLAMSIHLSTEARAENLVEADLWSEQSPYKEIMYATRAVVPLIGLLVGIIWFGLKEQLPYSTIRLPARDDNDACCSCSSSVDDESRDRDRDRGTGAIRNGDAAVIEVEVHAMVGVFEAYIGMILFNIGLRYGLDALGDRVGASVPGLFSAEASVPASPLFHVRAQGIAVVAVFSFFMAVCATYAEPALNAMGQTTEHLTAGAFPKSLLMFSVALGVGLGVMFGVLRMVLGWALGVMVCISYSFAVCLTCNSSIEYVSVAWDAAGVTTGSITVPLVLAMGLGLGHALKIQDAFGLLTMGSVGPIISVLVAGLVVRRNENDSDLGGTSRMSTAGIITDKAEVTPLTAPTSPGRPSRSSDIAPSDDIDSL